MEIYDGDFVVLFTSEGKGVTVWSRTASHKVGEYSTTLISSSSTKTWNLYEGSIKLSN